MSDAVASNQPDLPAHREESSASPPVDASIASAAKGTTGTKGADGASGPPSSLRSLVVAILAPLLLFFVLPPLGKSGLWDPYELNVADFARRIALNLHGAASLALNGADNSLPHLNDLGRPQLPFTSIALGFKFFGLHEWAGRLPLALWGFFGVLATYGFVARLVDRRAGAYAAIALTTTPLYFVQARSILGDVCTMSALAMSFGGLLVCVFDRDQDGPTTVRARLPWLLLGLVGLFFGYESRGGLLGLAVPLLSVSLAWLVVRTSARRERDPFGDFVGIVALVFGAAALGFGVRAILQDDTKNLSLWIGAMIRPPSKYPTFDFYIGVIGHGLAPWSAFLPFAFGRLFWPPVARKGHLFDRESATRVAIVIGASVSLAAHAYLAPKTDLIAFSGVAICAAAAGIAIRDFERGAHASLAVGLGTIVLAAVLHHDFHELPEKAYQAFAIAGATFPENFKKDALVLWWIVLGIFALCAFFTWMERDSDRKPFDTAHYAKLLKFLQEVWDGNLLMLYYAVVAGASLAGLVLFVGLRFHAKWLPAMPVMARQVMLNLWWIVAFVPLLVLFAVVFSADLWLWAFQRAGDAGRETLKRALQPFQEAVAQITKEQNTTERIISGLLAVAMFGLSLGVGGGIWYATRTFGGNSIVGALAGIIIGGALFVWLRIAGDLLRHRSGALAVAGALSGAILCCFYYPALANQLSPKEVFESYQRIHKNGEPLALFGVGGRTSAYYAGGQPESFTDASAALNWLMTGEGRRFMAVKAEELPKLNQLYRERVKPVENLPVLDTRSSQILLVSSALNANEENANPLSKIILPGRPSPRHPMDINMDDKLEIFGVDILDMQGRFVNAWASPTKDGTGQSRKAAPEPLVPGRKYKMRTYYHVLAPVTTEWEAFIHIDGYNRRHNGDHKPMGGKYPMSLWLKDDYLVDDYEFSLEPNFTQGIYTVYFGLFVGDTRLKVLKGPAKGDDRLEAGEVQVQ